MHFHFDYGENLESCPKVWQHTFISYPSATIIFAVFSLTSFIFSIVVGCKYNSVRVFNRKIRTQNISNTLWILYYLVEGVRGVCSGLRYALENEESIKPFETALFLATLILYGIAALILSLALNHQRKYRSSIIPATSANKQADESEPLIAQYAWVKRSITGSEALFFLLFIIYLVFLFLQIVEDNRHLFEILFLSAFGLQRVPIVILVFMIVINRSSSNDGPTRRSKVFLCMAALLNIAGDLPLAVWAQILPRDCVFYVASWVDLVHTLYYSSLLFFFLFIRSEYLRNMEECIWDTVSQIQDTFDFRRFT